MQESPKLQEFDNTPVSGRQQQKNSHPSSQLKSKTASTPRTSRTKIRMESLTQGIPEHAITATPAPEDKARQKGSTLMDDSLKKELD